jgi:hypothetical protein
VLGWLLAARAAAPCDSTACLLQTRGNNGVPRKGSLTVDFSFRYTEENVGMQGTDHVDVVRAPWVDFERQHIWPRFHQEVQSLDRLYQVDAVVGVGWGSAVQVSMPVYTHRTYQVYHGADPFTYRTDGPGDLVIGFRHAMTSRVVAALYFKLPTGPSTIHDPYGAYILDPMVQPGTGSYDFSGALQYGFRLAGCDGSLSGSAQGNRANELGYRFGSDVIGAGTLRRHLAGPVSASLQLKGMITARSTYLGEEVPSTGGRLLYLNPGVQIGVAGRGTAYAYVPFPVYRDVNDQQLTPRLSVLVGVSKSF